MYNVLLYTQNKDGDFVLSNESNVKTLRKGDNLFRDAEFTTWKTPLDCLDSGVSMFYNSSLTEWKTDLPNLINGENMFTYSDLTSFHSALPLLSNGTKMLANTPLSAFSEDMPFLLNGSYMFQNSKIEHYSSYTKRLTNGKGMFKGCTNLSEFIGSLESLEIGEEMFNGCILNATSVAFIASTIKKYPKKNITHFIDISIDCNDNFPSITKFAQDAGYTTWVDLINAFTNKGWGVNFHARGKLIESDKINISRTFDLSTFPRVGDTTATLNGSFTVSVYGSKATNCKATIKTNDIALDGLTLLGSAEIVTYVYVNEEGQITNPTTFDLIFSSFSNTTMYLISGQFEIRGNAFGITISNNPIEVSITDDFVSIDYNNDGQVINYNLKNLEDGSNLFNSFTDITSFKDDLSALKDGTQMFQYCSNLSSFETNNISSLSNGYNMFYGCTSLSSVLGNFESLVDGSYMFYNTRLNSLDDMEFPSLVKAPYMFYSCGDSRNTLNANFPALTNGEYMFYNTSFKDINCECPVLTNGSRMFYTSSASNYNLIMNNLEKAPYMFYYYFTTNSTSSSSRTPAQFSGELNKLSQGDYMFFGCGRLTSFSVPSLDNLTSSRYMFWNNYKLGEFNVNLPNLKDGSYMFYRYTKYSSNTPLSIADKLNLSSLTDGSYMFYNTDLTQFSSSLPSLTNGSNMFYGCTLDRDSVLFIVNDLKTNNLLKTSGSLTIGTSKDFQNDDELRFALGETSEQKNNQSGEKYPNDYPQYIDTKIKSAGGGTWSIKTYWY